MAEIHESGEMYLETILVLKEQLGMVRSIDVAREMDFSKPSVSIGMKKLRDGGYIDVDEDGYISLTKSGMDVAKKIYERHKVLSSLLKHLGVDPDVATDDACKIEHDISDETFEAIKKFAKEHCIIE